MLHKGPLANSTHFPASLDGQISRQLIQLFPLQSTDTTITFPRPFTPGNRSFMGLSARCWCHWFRPPGLAQWQLTLQNAGVNYFEVQEVTVLIFTSVWLRELALTMTLAFFWVSSWPSPSAAFSESRNRRLPRSNPITTTWAVCNKQFHYETAHSISTP